MTSNSLKIAAYIALVLCVFWLGNRFCASYARVTDAPPEPTGTNAVATKTDSATPEQAARNYLSDCGSLFGIKDQAAELNLLRKYWIMFGIE